MKKNVLACIFAAVSFVCVSTVFTSCSEQTSIPAEEKVVTEYKTVEKSVERIIGNTLVAQTLNDRLEVLYNGKLALTASVAPDSLTKTLPIALHKASTIDGDNNRWQDSNGMGFTGSIIQNQLEGLNLVAYLKPASPFSKIIPIHKYVTLLDGEFDLAGRATLEETGESKELSIPVPTGRYFMCDDSVEVITVTETEYQIVYRDTTEYIHIDKNLIIVSAFGYGTINYTIGNKSFSFRLDLDSALIHRSENEWGVAKLTDENSKGFTLSDAQKGTYTIKEDGISLKSVNFIGTNVSFSKLNDLFKYGTPTVKVVVSEGEDVRDFTVGASYFHEKNVEKAEPEVVVPPVTTEHTYTVDSVRSDVKDSEGNLIGQKMRLTVTREDGKKWKIQYLAWETGLLSPTITGTQVGGNSMLRATTWTDPEYVADGWSGTDTSRDGFKVVSTSKEYKFRTPFPKVPGFGGNEESVAESNIVFGTRTCTFEDPENTEFSFTISADGVNSNETSVKVIQDEVGTDEAAKAEVNGRGLEYTYCGTHYLSVEQYVGKTLVLTQTRAEQLLSPKN